MHTVIATISISATLLFFFLEPSVFPRKFFCPLSFLLLLLQPWDGVWRVLRSEPRSPSRTDLAPEPHTVHLLLGYTALARSFPERLDSTVSHMMI